MIRHLIFDCCALHEGATIQWVKEGQVAAGATEARLNVEKLLQYADVFTGRKIIVLRVGDLVYPPEMVKPWFEDFGDVEFVERENQPLPEGLREAHQFDENLRMIESTSPDESFFYAHTKGVSHGNPLMLYSVRWWRNTMYEECLKDPEKIDKLLQTYACVGCFKQEGSPAGCPRSMWHYPGTFYWIKSDRLFTKPDWDDIPRHAYAAEGFPGIVFKSEEGCLLYDKPFGNLYEARAPYVCQNCGHKYETTHIPGQKPIKTCPMCFKRRAEVDQEWLNGPLARALSMPDMRHDV